MDKNTLKSLGLFSIVMITVTSVVSIRNLPATALFGEPMIVFFTLGALLFLIPSALVSAELSSAWPQNGGVYVWVKEAFGKKWGFLAIWFQWMENIIWFPTILSFVAGTLVYTLSPNLASNKFCLMAIIIGTFWLLTFINLAGIRLSARFSAFCGILGLMMPMALIITLGILWFVTGKPLEITLNAHNIIPDWKDPGLLASITAIVLCFCGMEIATVHAQDVRDPHITYPRALIISVVFMYVVLLAGALAIAFVVPKNNLSLVAGSVQALTEFLKAYHLQSLTPLIAICIILGSLGGISNWIIASNRGLCVALKDSGIAAPLHKENVRGVPKNLLMFQAILVTVVSSIFLLMPSVNSSYWMLTAITAQIYMGMYVLMFAAAIYLRYKKSHIKRPFKIPGGKMGLWFTAGIGFFTSLFTIGIGFVPPAGISVGSVDRYDTIMLIGLLLLSSPPFLLQRFKKKSQEADSMGMPATE